MKEKKKIIFSSYDNLRNPFYAGGGAVAIYQVTTRLASMFEIVVITGNYTGAKNKKIENVFYKHIGPSFLGPKLGQLFFYFLLPFYVLNEKYDIWVENFTPPFSTACLQLFTKKPVIGLVHMLSGRDMERKYKLPFRIIEKKGLALYKYFIVLRETTKKTIEQFNKHAKFFIIPNGVNQVTFSENSRKGDYLLFIGRLEFDQKGLDLLIDAYQSISGNITQKLIIAGSGTKKDEFRIKQRIMRYGLEDKIQLVGKVEGKEKDLLLRNCSLVVLPSRFETFSLVTLEAMSYGKPLVSFAIQGLDWMPYGCAVKVQPFDIKQYADAIQNILEDKSLQKKMSNLSYKASLRYSWKNISDAYEKAFLTILQTV